MNFKNSFHFPFAIRYYLFVQHLKWVDAVFRFAIHIEKISIRQTTERNAQQMHVVFLFVCFFKSKESSGAVLHSSLTFLARALHSLCCQPHFFAVVWLRRSSKWWLIRIYTKNRLSLIYFWVLLNAAGRQLNAGRKQRAYADCKNSVRMREREEWVACVCASYAVGLPWYLAESHLNDIIT